jgi:hypothetical protein
MLTYACVCLRMLPYACVCLRMLAYAVRGSATELQQSCNRGGSWGLLELQQSCNRAATELQQSCNRAATELQQSCNVCACACSEGQRHFHRHRSADLSRESCTCLGRRRARCNRASTEGARMQQRGLALGERGLRVEHVPKLNL